MGKIYLENCKCECGGKFILRNGKFGYFWGCKRFPHCLKTLSISDVGICPECFEKTFGKITDGVLIADRCKKCGYQTHWKLIFNPKRGYNEVMENEYDNQTQFCAKDWMKG